MNRCCQQSKHRTTALFFIGSHLNTIYDIGFSDHLSHISPCHAQHLNNTSSRCGKYQPANNISPNQEPRVHSELLDHAAAAFPTRFDVTFASRN